MTRKPEAPTRVVRVEPTMLEAASRPSRRVLVALALVCVAIFAPGLGGDFVSDDSLLLSHAREVVETRGIGAVFRQEMFFHESGARSGFYRPLGTLSLLLDQAIYGDRTFGYHLTSLLVHVLATWLVLYLALHIGLAIAPALATAGLFAVHPVHVEAVAWISGRFDLLCGLLMLLSLWLFGRAHTARRGWMYLGSVVAGTAALLAKEMALSLPGLVLLFDGLGLSRGRGPRRVVVDGLWREGWRGTTLRALPFIAVVVAYLALRATTRSLGFEASNAPERLPQLELVCTAGGAFLYYVGSLLFPFRLNALPTVASITSPVDPRFLFGLALFFGFGMAALRLRKRHPIIAFGLLCFLASLVPLSNALGSYALMRVRFPVAERYLYFPSFAFLLTVSAIGWSVATRFGALRGFTIVGTALGLICGVQSILRVPVWRSNEALFSDMLRRNPASALPHLMMGWLRNQQGDLASAEEHISRAMQIDPQLYTGVFDMAMLRVQAGRYEEAIALYERALQIEPRARDARLGLALALRRAGRLPEAAQQYQLLGDLGARDSEFLVNRGELYLATGQLDAAAQDFEAALAVNPRRKEAMINLGIVALRRGEPEAAEALARRALEVDPRDAHAHLLLGNIAVSRGDFVAAASEFGRGAELDTTNVQLLVNQGAALLNVGDFVQAQEVLRRSLRIQPTAHAWTNLAEAERRNKKLIEAEASYRQALALDPALVAAKRGLGILLADDPARALEARRLLEPIAAVSPEDAEVRDALVSMAARRR